MSSNTKPTTIAYNQLLQEVYSPESFHQFADICRDKLQNYLLKNLSEPMNQPVFPPGLTPESLLERVNDWTTQNEGLPAPEKFDSFLELILNHSMQVHHPRFMGHQVSASIPMATLMDSVSSMINNGAAIFEMGPMESVLEKYLIDWLSERLGWKAGQAGGIFTSGGSLGNLTALLAARKRLPGNISLDTLGVLVSAESHYCVSRSLAIMGIPPKNIFQVPTVNFSIDPNQLDTVFAKAQQDKIHLFAVIANAGSTSTGTFDNIRAIGEFCQKHDIWLHVDGAHGGPAVLSPQLKAALLDGIELADSIVIDAHKMMLMPALITAVVFRDFRDSYLPFSQHAPFLFSDELMGDEWYTLGKRTFECTKKGMVFKLFITLQIYGEEFFAAYLENCQALTRYFYDSLQANTSFEALKQPDLNIICFRHTGGGNDLQAAIRDALLQKGVFYVVSTQIQDRLYLRCTIINPFTSRQDIDTLLQTMTEIAVAHEKAEQPA